MPSAKSKRAQSKRYYQQNRAKILSARKEAYVESAEELKSEARASYQANPNGKKAASRASSKRSYSIDPESKKAASRASSKRSYSIDPERKKLPPKHAIS